MAIRKIWRAACLAIALPMMLTLGGCSLFTPDIPANPQTEINLPPLPASLDRDCHVPPLTGDKGLGSQQVICVPGSGRVTKSSCR